MGIDCFFKVVMKGPEMIILVFLRSTLLIKKRKIKSTIMLLEIIERKSYPNLLFDKKLLENISPLRGKKLASEGYLYSHEFIWFLSWQGLCPGFH